MAIARRSFLIAGSAFGAMACLHPFSARAATGQAHLRIMTTTDLHCHIYPYDYYADKPNDTVGLARTATLIDAVRAEATNTILVDNGDYIQGNPLGDFMAYKRGMREGDTHPVIAAMNVLGYDAGTVGNHEFNYGIDFLEHVNKATSRPIVCANFANRLGVSPLEDDLFFRPYVILERTLKDGTGQDRPIRIGLIGFVTPQIMQWDAAHLAGKYATRDIVDAARAWIPKMKSEGADIVIALSHSGLSTDPQVAGMENASYYLAQVPGIDAMVTGHQHLVWPGKDFSSAGMNAANGRVHGVPSVMAGFWGSHMGLIDLLLEHDGKGWSVVEGDAEARPIYERSADRKVTPLVNDTATILAAAKQGHDDTLTYVRAEVGRTDAPLYSYFAQVADDPSVQIVSKAQTWYVEQLLKGSPYADLPLLSAAAPFKAGGRGGPDYYTDVAAGPIAIKNISDLYLYPNTLQVVKITGDDLKEWLERSAGQFNQILPGAQNALLIDTRFPSYNFDTIDGVNYLIDLSQPSKYLVDTGALANPDASRIKNLTYKGQMVDPGQEFIVATNNYRASGGGHFPGAGGSTVILAAPDTNRDVLVRYVVEEGTVSPTTDGNWAFAPMPGTTAIFETGPKARNYLEAVRARGVKIEDAGDGEGGFARYRLTL